MERKLGTEQRLIFRAPGWLLPSIPDGVASQKCYFAEFLPEWLRCLDIDKREDFSMFLMFSGIMSPCDPIPKQVGSQENPLSKISDTRSSIFLSFLMVSFLDVVFKWHCQLNQVNKYCLFCYKKILCGPETTSVPCCWGFTKATKNWQNSA